MPLQLTGDVMIHIIGPNKFQNQLLRSFLEVQTSLRCKCCSESEMQAITDNELRMRRLALWDCLNFGTDFRNWLGNDFNPECLVALFNVLPVRGIEQHAMERGVQGIFYTDDSSEMFLRGVVSILNKELWYPRKILSDQIRNGNGAYSGKHLTFREKDVLLRIVSRNSNHEIAEELSISIHTVKKHLYNIYRKINVPSRFQAARWALRNL